ncbi:ATP-binding domain-containing protein [Isoptericola sp. BMS4]|uniref:HelD family protein n=1 Tax=Isoptericola sp. BMS4 TaxID=2527875 RepID=UPI00196B7DB3|nr:ATP-binding domain-containing protein [Isoptericola sp. BMS4]
MPQPYQPAVPPPAAPAPDQAPHEHPHDAATPRLDTDPPDHGRQVALERSAVRRMHDHVDTETARLRGELARALRSRPEDSTELHQRDARVRMLERRLRALEAGEHHLCFGRVDTVDGRALHVGRLGLHPEDTPEPLLVDWRADAARPFYAATPVRPLGLRRRRHLRLEGRDVVGVSDEILDGSEPDAADVVGDGPLMAALGARRTGRMREVVATLQAEQDEVVRSPHRGVVVVTGGPGTGKTVVALHRAAYVLAAFDGVADDGVLVLGPNDRFLDYISRVLPSLGENDVVLATASSVLRGASPAAAAVPADARDASDLARVAGRAVLADLLAAAVRAHQAPGAPDLVVRVGGDDVRLSPDDVAAARALAQGTDLPHHGARGVFHEAVVEALVDAVVADAEATLARIDAESAELTGRDLDAMAAAGLRSLGLDGVPGTDAADELDPDTLRDELLTDPVLDRAVERLWPRLDAAAVVREVLRAVGRDVGGGAQDVPAPPAGWDAAERALLAASADGALTQAHLPLLDEAVALLDGEPERTFGHVVVDEAQELTPLQWRAVLRRCPSRSLTVVGDLAQAGPTAEHATWRDALGADLWRRAEVRTLTVSYRTTAEILAEAGAVLERVAPAQEPGTAVRHGPEPRRTTAPQVGPVSLADAVAREAAAAGREVPGGLVGVVAADLAVAGIEAALERAADGAPADGRGGSRVRVVPVSQSRGLEFDAVVVADPGGILAARPCGERDLYVALTRATTTLTVVDAG